MIPDIIHFKTLGNKVFIEKSREGFLIDVFDSNGEKLYQIEKSVNKIKVTKEDEVKIMNKFKNDPLIKQIGFENFKRMGKMIFPEFFPVIGGIKVANKKIYVRTYKNVKGKEEYIVMDLKGKILKRIYLPIVDNAPIMVYLMGVKYYLIYNDKFYYIRENENNEEWKRYITEI